MLHFSPISNKIKRFFVQNRSFCYWNKIICQYKMTHLTCIFFSAKFIHSESEIKCENKQTGLISFHFFLLFLPVHNLIHIQLYIGPAIAATLDTPKFNSTLSKARFWLFIQLKLYLKNSQFLANCGLFEITLVRCTLAWFLLTIFQGDFFET